MGNRSICVFCSSSKNVKPEYMQQARELGNEFLKNGFDLIYGGGTVGIMGEIARTIQSGGGKVTGIIPTPLIEHSGECIGESIEVSDMHTRKSLMHSKCDAFVAMPGGYGTMEELLEMITWSQLSIHTKPVIIFNVNGFYDLFLQWLDLSVEENFITAGNRQIVVACNTAEEVIQMIQSYKVPETTYQLTWKQEEREKLIPL
ncbi:hypothetical protein K493DRAFT_315171 [Basidiobolus meristosporus CBS 931.73]|uniref:Cytokinin riboside 5'-monophosphate phosphoribohydrolase n=1 Tax=Basidiobolus meristosporus CBS 931.73 TaxID=1314790 RepID=A0A1Y1YAS9_9FUNG|nr:hypothetical protein K493DRAFT_315171 [Basidiobolus meristosporus CBS 931.73]|eukprot:ORX95078.1 hypothetical protein K493DRAFT_315171 [Basidiobolus meristosporus CBS 931.73]